MIVADTGPLYAVADKSDSHHAASVAYFSSNKKSILVPSLVVTEVAYLLQSRIGPKAEVAFLQALTSGVFKFVELTSADLNRVAELTDRYLDLPLGVADASVVAVAERYNISEIATVDATHFRIVRPKHVDAFTLEPL